MQTNEPSSGYWYGGDEDSRRATAVLNSVRRYRASEAEMQRRTRARLGLGETDLAAIRLLVEAEKEGRMVSPKQISQALGITTASTTKLLDRLVDSGHVERRPHPTDRRGLIIIPTWDAELGLRSTLAREIGGLSAVAGSLGPDESQVVTSFLERMTTAIDVADQTPPPA